MTFTDYAPSTRCPLTTNGEHDIEWLDVPAMEWNGEYASNIPAHRRGFCWVCDERFID